MSYTSREFTKNKLVLILIKVIIAFAYLWITSIFLLLLEKTAFSLLGILFSTGICILAYKVIRNLELENKKDLSRNSATWGKGLDAENVVKESLTRLPKEFKILEDYNTGKGNIDFIVIGPTGIYTLEVKAAKGVVGLSKGFVTINNLFPEKNYLHQTEAERYWLESWLFTSTKKRYGVTGILSFPNGRINRNDIHGPIGTNLWISEGKFHIPLITSSRSYLLENEISEIYQLLKNGDTRRTLIKTN